MAGLKFDISQYARVGDWFDKTAEQAAERAALGTAARLVNHIVTEVIPRTDPKPVDRGLYRAAWRFRKVPGGAVVMNTSPHAPFIEHGVRAKSVKPGKAMIIALAGWVKRKGLTSSKGKGAAQEARQIAWAIAMSMRKKGIFKGGKGLRILERAAHRIQDFFEQEFAREMKRGFKT